MKHNRLIIVLSLLIVAMSVQAQSGRRQVKPPSVAPVPTPTPEATPTPKKEKEQEPELVFLVAANRNSGPMSVPFTYYDAAQRGCAERLKARSSAGVDVAERDITRGEAIEKAKKEQRTYVVLLSLVIDTMSSTYDDLQLDFLLLEPATARVVITGRAYMNPNRKGPLVVGPTGRVPAMYREQLLREAGQEAADKILKKMQLASPPI